MVVSSPGRNPQHEGHAIFKYLRTRKGGCRNQFNTSAQHVLEVDVSVVVRRV